MTFAGPCQICSEKVCECQSQLAKYIALLYGAHQRVSTLKQTSVTNNKIPVSACIDKLAFKLRSALPESELRTRLLTSGQNSRAVKLRDKRWYLQVGEPESGTYFKIFPAASPEFRPITQFFARPSVFSTFERFYNHIALFLSPSEIENLHISRMDLALDYALPLTEVLRGFEFKRKQSQISFQDRCGRRTGLIIGRGTEKILLYDKAIESNLQTPLTRIEIQIAGAKLPTRKLSQLEMALVYSKWNPFQNIQLSEVDLATNISSLTSEEQKKLSTLYNLIEREGLFSAKRALNRHGNFWRDYGPLFSLKPHPCQPPQFFKEKISRYFTQTKKETPHDH